MPHNPAWRGAPAVVIVPIECDANVPFTCPISGDRVVFLEDGKEVICMLAAGVLDSEIVDHKGKLDGALFVAPEAGDKLALEVPMCIEACFKEFICKEACLWETIHAVLHENVHGAARVGQAGEVVFRYDLLGDVTEFYSEVFQTFQGGHEVKF